MSRGGKSKDAYLPGDLVALGSKASRVEPNPRGKRGSNISLHRKLMESTSPEMALSLLLETSNVGIHKSLNTTPMITKTISTMNLQSEY